MSKHVRVWKNVMLSGRFTIPQGDVPYMSERLASRNHRQIFLMTRMRVSGIIRPLHPSSYSRMKSLFP